MAKKLSHSAENKVEVEIPVNPMDMIIAMQKQIDLLQKQLQETSKNNNISINDVVEEKENDSFEEFSIRQDEYIKVVSLCPYQLNLSTEGMGKGKVFTFHEFGQTKRILYSDLVQILESHQSFTNDGLFYIADKRVQRRHGLDDTYAGILSKDKIEKILSGKGNSNDIMSLFKSANKKQQETIAEMMIIKLQEDPDSIDLNLVDKIGRETGIEIQKKAEEGKEFSDILISGNEVE